MSKARGAAMPRSTRSAVNSASNSLRRQRGGGASGGGAKGSKMRLSGLKRALEHMSDDTETCTTSATTQAHSTKRRAKSSLSPKGASKAQTASMAPTKQQNGHTSARDDAAGRATLVDAFGGRPSVEQKAALLRDAERGRVMDDAQLALLLSDSRRNRSSTKTFAPWRASSEKAIGDGINVNAEEAVTKPSATKKMKKKTKVVVAASAKKSAAPPKEVAPAKRTANKVSASTAMKGASLRANTNNVTVANDDDGDGDEAGDDSVEDDDDDDADASWGDAPAKKAAKSGSKVARVTRSSPTKAKVPKKGAGRGGSATRPANTTSGSKRSISQVSGGSSGAGRGKKNAVAKKKAKLGAATQPPSTKRSSTSASKLTSSSNGSALARSPSTIAAGAAPAAATADTRPVGAAPTTSFSGSATAPKYSKISVNAGRTKLYDVAEVPRCQCSVTSAHEEKEECCGDSCLNRLLHVECAKQSCPCGERCTNRRFQRRQYKKVRVAPAGAKGFGLYAKEAIRAGDFVIEYVGEVLDSAELRQRRLEAKSAEKNYYYFDLGTGQALDASRRGNDSRFMNHSCDPNCVTQKWEVGGYACIGMFASRDVAVGDELTFDYQFDQIGVQKQACYCGAPNCRQYLGAKPPVTDEQRKRAERKRVTLKKLTPKQLAQLYSLEVQAHVDHALLCTGYQPTLRHALAADTAAQAFLDAVQEGRGGGKYRPSTLMPSVDSCAEARKRERAAIFFACLSSKLFLRRNIRTVLRANDELLNSLERELEAGNAAAPEASVRGGASMSERRRTRTTSEKPDWRVWNALGFSN